MMLDSNRSRESHADRVWVIAHRGASRDHPENTHAAFEAAIAQGCDAIELDLQLSRDGVPVVYHDRTLTRAGGGRRRVAELDLADLRRLDAASRGAARRRGESIPTLADVLDRYSGRATLLLEIKTREGRGGDERHLQLARTVADQVRSSGCERQTLLLCFDGDLLDAAAQAAPRLRRVLNIKPPPRLPGTLRRKLDTLWAVSADVRTLTPQFAAALRRCGCRLLVFTCNTPRTLRAALTAGPVGVMSDRPDWLRERLAAVEHG